MVSDLYLFEVKKPSESKRDWGYYKLLATVSGSAAYPTAANSRCPLTKLGIRAGGPLAASRGVSQARGPADKAPRGRARLQPNSAAASRASTI